MRLYLAVSLPAAFLLAAFLAVAIPCAAAWAEPWGALGFPMSAAVASVPPAPAMAIPVRAPKMSLRQIARASRPSGGHRMLYTSKRALR